MSLLWSPAVKLLSISPEQARVRRRGFTCDSETVRARLEEIGASFLAGYHAVLHASQMRALMLASMNGAACTDLCSRLESCVEPANTGFAFEGAGMALALLDGLKVFGRGRLQRFQEQVVASRHPYMLHVGAGWAAARLPWLKWNLERWLSSMDPLLRWLVVDGYGFHEGYFKWRVSIAAQRVPGGVRGYARRAFDQGLGRSLWFVEGASPQRVACAIGRFTASRQSDLWSGVGLASTYAGGVSRNTLEQLARLGGARRRELAQGAAFAAKARALAGNLTAHTRIACEVFCGVSAEDAASITDAALPCITHAPPHAVSAQESYAAYEAWRQNIGNSFPLPATSNSTAKRTFA